MSKIYLYCVPLGTGSGMVTDSSVGGDVMGYALAEDGKCLASHLSSNNYFSKHDMGLNSGWKHEAYISHYPNGFELEWVDNPDEHDGWKKAFELNNLERIKNQNKNE